MSAGQGSCSIRNLSAFTLTCLKSHMGGGGCSFAIFLLVPIRQAKRSQAQLKKNVIISKWYFNTGLVVRRCQHLHYA